MSYLLQCFENIVKKHPEKSAVVLRKQCISFGELLLFSKRIGTALSELKFSNRPIGVIADRSIEPLAGFIGVLYSNNFYIPVDAEMPVEKIKHIIEDADFPAIVCDRKYDDILMRLNYEGAIIHYDDLPIEVCEISSEPNNDHLYMVYTSGSTGMPTGVLKTQSGELSFIDAFWEQMELNEDDIIGNQTPFFFDAAAKDIFLMILKGITLVIIPTELFALPPELIDYLNEEKITVVSWVPTVISLVAQLNPFRMYKPNTLRKVLFVGEVMPMKHLNLWRRELPNITYVNLYGQTELAGICSFFVVKGEYSENAVLPIGKALNNCELYLVDNNTVVTEANHIGELYVVSDALAQCYWNDEEKTRNSFLVRDFGRGDVRCFKTGDMAKYDNAGNLLFAARKDNQIKHLGHRIELGEIETAAGSISDIDRCCCVYNQEKRKIILFCQLTPDSSKTGKEIRSKLKTLLSSYMLPGKVIVKEKLPVNRNGKIDRQALKNEI